MIMTLETSPLTLYVRAGFDGKKYGACPLCQRVFMVLILKARAGRLRFRVVTVCPGRPGPAELQRHGLRNLPAMVHKGGDAIDTVEEIIDYIDAKFREPDLNTRNELVDKITRNIFSKFCYFIKSVSKDEGSALLTELDRLNTYFIQHPEFPFTSDPNCLETDGLTGLDCELLPKLHHLRVACRVLKNLDIPANMSGIWRYLHHAYNLDVFVKSCPPDQEIVLHWADRLPKNCSIRREDRAALTREKPIFSFDVPATAIPARID